MRSDALWATSAAVLSLAAAVWSLRIWDWTWGTPFTLDGDGPFVAMQLRDLADQGWYWHNPDLGYPFGQTGSLFPELNAVHLLIVKVLGLAFADPFSPGVVYFLLGFPLAALAMFALCRSQGLSPAAGFLAGVLFANAPGHQERFPHLWLAAYWVVPLGMWLVLEVLQGRAPFRKRPGVPGVRGWVNARTAAALVAVVLVGLSGVYYVAFTLVLLAAAMLGRRWIDRTPRGWLAGMVPAVLLTGVFLVPVLVARWGTRAEVLTGRNPTQRSFVESETYAGKLMDLILPWTGHLVDPLAFLSFAYNTSSRATVEVSALGVVGALGWTALLVVALSATLGVKRPEQLRRWSALALVATAFYTVGGFGAWVAIFVTPQVRTWSRLSLYILLLSLLAVGWWLTRLESRRGRVVAGVVAVCLTAVGVLDQVNPAKAPRHDEVAARFASAERYTSELQNELGDGCPVFQLPVVPFPESAGLGAMKGYDQLIPYLASDDLRFSSGAMRGTTRADWQLAVELDDVPRMTEDLSAAGFCAVEVNAQGFAPETDPRKRLTSSLGVPTATSSDGVFSAWALRKRPQEPSAARSRALKPTLVALDAYTIETDATSTSQMVGPDVSLRLVNLGAQALKVTVTFEVLGIDGQRREMTISSASSAVAGAEMTDKPVQVRFTMLVPPGTTALAVHTSGDPVRQLDTGLMSSARIGSLTASSTDPDRRVVSLQEQVASGAVVP